MRITVFGSGSKGNSTLIETENNNILIDTGLSLKSIEERLNNKLPKIDTLLITHTHQDHIKGIKSVLKKHNPKIYTTESNLHEKITNEISYDKEIKIDNLIINLFEVSHDTPCIGIEIVENENKIVYITDTGYLKNKLLEKYKNATIYILESNYEEDMLMNGTYPFYLKQRIRSDKGHLSNDDTCRYLKTLVGPNTKYLCMAHLSEENNKPEIVKEKVDNTLKEIENKVKKVIICKQDEMIQITL